MKTPRNLRSGIPPPLPGSKKASIPGVAGSPDQFTRLMGAHAALRSEYELILAFAASAFESLVPGGEKH
ncbi:hypothetical protein [Mesorhizobium sp. WSM3868]|uniref:hypothetical protein n=1 Tax=Mesorhizobium sp. WSM3868 TaxID=2029405 RepID=UPI001180496D|nr:hypothetical protein [Mesorhizobium sp. WSM3868]